MAFNVNFNPSSTISGWNNAATKFFYPPVANPGQISILGNGLKGAAKEGSRKAGYYLNTGATNVANKAGEKLLNVMTSNSSVGNALLKVPGLDKLANGLTKVGQAGSRIPGIGTVIALATGVIGIGKSINLASKGDGKGAGHRLVKTAGSIAGIMAGAALMATGVGFLPGLALAVGAGVAGDWAGKKVGDTLFGQVDPQSGHSLSYIKANTKIAEQTSNQGNLFGTGVAIGSNEEFDSYINNILSSPALS